MTWPAPARHRFTATEYQRLAAVLGEDSRVELLDGEVVDMAPIGSRHAACVIRLTHLLTLGLSGRAVVSVQNPLLLSDVSVPQPDVAVLRPRGDFYAGALPGPEDALLVVEVADSSLPLDRGLKAELYAAAGVPLLWIVDLESEIVEHLADPRDRRYSTLRQAGRGTSLTVSGTSVAVDDILG
jgi:Uma2 family endonuclease